MDKTENSLDEVKVPRVFRTIKVGYNPTSFLLREKLREPVDLMDIEPLRYKE